MVIFDAKNIRLIHMSKTVGAQTSELSESILRQAHAWNTQNDVTGVLCQGQDVFLQVLEGKRAKVTKLYARIHADPRHKDLGLLHCESISARCYGDWSMAYVCGGQVFGSSQKHEGHVHRITLVLG